MWTRGALSLVLKISSSCEPKGRALPAAEVHVAGSVAQSCALFATAQAVAYQASLSMGLFSDKNTGACCHFPPPKDLPNPGIKPETPCLLHCRQILYQLSHQGSPIPCRSTLPRLSWLLFRVVMAFRSQAGGSECFLLSI